MDREAVVSTTIRCDGCNVQLDTSQNPNWWKATLQGDVLRGAQHRPIEDTGVSSRGSRQYRIPLDDADLCLSCMAKTQEETTHER